MATIKISPEKLLALIASLHEEVRPGSHRRWSITLDSSFVRDLGLDSLTRMELLSRLEKTFNITLPEQEIFSAETPRDLLRILQMKTAGPVAEKIESAAPESFKTEKMSLPDQATTMVQVLRHHAENTPDRLHIRIYSDAGDGETISYGELWREAGKVAAGLQRSGLAPGEAVMIMLPTGRSYFFTFFGVLLAGGVPVPVYPPGRIKQLEEHLRRHGAIAANCRAGTIITMKEAKSFSQLIHRQITTLEHITTFADIVQAGRNTPLMRPSLSAQNTALLQYTSGSTGRPKGVVLSHANLLANIRAMGRTIGVSGEDVFVSWLPLYHDMGLIGAWLGSLYFGCPLIIMSPLTFLAGPIRWLRAVSRYRGTLSAAPNFAYEFCAGRINDADLADLELDSWRCAFNGAEAVSPLTMKKFSDRFASCGFREETMMPVYGLAESSVGLAFPPLHRKPRVDCIRRRQLTYRGLAVKCSPDYPEHVCLASSGLPLPGHQIRIVDDGGRELPDRQEGFIQFTGPSATSGYFHNPEQTAKLFQGKWLNSGDKGYIADGEIFITGRSKDIIIKAGRNIYPVELEEAIGKITGIREGNVAVFAGIAPETGTEKLIVLAETRKRKQDARAGLRSMVNGIVSDITGSAPDEVILAPPNTVLKTSSGKIRRSAVRELYEQGEVGKPHPPLRLQFSRYLLSSVRPQFRRLGKKAATLAYAGYCWLIVGFFTPLLWLLIIILPGGNIRWQITRLTVKLILSVCGIRLTVEGINNLPGKDTPIILVANHASYVDSMILSAVLPRPVRFIAKGELKKNPLLHLLLKRLDVFFVERFEYRQGIADADLIGKESGNGGSFLFFAEGTFMRMPGILPFRMGAFYAAVKGGLPIIPITVRGTRALLRAESWFPRRAAITVKIGRSIPPEQDFRQENYWDAAVSLRNRVRNWILQHSGEPDLEYENPLPLPGE